MTTTESTGTESAADADLTAAEVTWNLETLLDGVDAPDALLDEAEALASDLETHRGSVGTMDAASLADVMGTMARIAELMSRAGTTAGSSSPRTPRIPRLPR